MTMMLAISTNMSINSDRLNDNKQLRDALQFPSNNKVNVRMLVTFDVFPGIDVNVERTC